MEELVTKIAPPIILGIGLIIPISVKASPFALPEKIKPLAAVVFALVMWVAYFLTIGWAPIWNYANWVTAWTALGATILLGAVLIAAWRKGGELQELRYFGIFVLAIFLLALASANWVAQKDLEIIAIESDSTIEYIGIRKLNSSGDYQRVYTADTTPRTTVTIFLEKEEMAKIDNIMVNKSPNGIDKLVRVHSGFPAKRHVLPK